MTSVRQRGLLPDRAPLVFLVMKNDRSISAREEARRRWGNARVLPGGQAARPKRGARRIRRSPGTAEERRLVERIVGHRLPAKDLADAIRLLRAGAKLKELEINERIESMLNPDER